jgi:hypothetical protein
MRDKIVVYEKISFKTIKRPTSPYEKKHPTRQFRSPVNYSLFHRWITSIVRYMVCLDMFFILDGGDGKQTLQQGFVHFEK